ncbi:hypothetical protein EV182_004033 [Spiromyces aspiralis]|uniref:Uncharacterized protein n=1 Tax=Spiromyces aspiralis TaxID=68401 RepID=A0ACC1HSV5_9FUNG|nr:hypothetical protein EV182_004033 [Spiromyces aspiralis]
MPYYYAVRNGRTPGIYNTWDDCKAQVDGFSASRFRKFSTLEDAQGFISGRSSPGSAAAPPRPAGRPSGGSSGSGPRWQSTSAYPASSFSSPAPAPAPATVIYTDGASRGNGRAGSRAGYGVYFGPNDPRNISEPLAGPSQTNQRAELTAIIEGMEKSMEQRGQHIIVNTDSHYAMKSLTQWHKAWEKNGWTNSRGSQVENQDLIKRGLELIRNYDGKVDLQYVPGHSGDAGNDMADRLAVQGAAKNAR